MAVNKVVYNSENGAETLIDLTGDSVTPETLAVGATAHDASGNVINGILSPEDGEDGVGISNATINSSGHLVLTYTDGNVVDVGKVVGSNGTTPTIKAAAGSNINTVGTPSVTASTSGTTTTFTFNNLKGAKGDKGDNATTTSAATQSAAGLMSAADKTKLDGIDASANNYSLPTASSTLGGVKTTSTVTSTSGLTACPIIEGVPYYKNTTYSNATLGQGYATCATAAATTAKVGTLSSYALVTGGIVAVKFTYAVPANATLNINSKGAKAIYYKGKAIVAGVIDAGEVATFLYDGTYYHLLAVDRNRFYTSLVPYGTAIVSSTSAPVNLNTATYMKVGNYYCASNANAAGLTNVPIANKAFMMQVSSPLSTTIDNENGTWVYRIRKLMHYTGEEYTQYCYTNGTAGNWIYGPWNKTVVPSDIPIKSVAVASGSNIGSVGTPSVSASTDSSGKTTFTFNYLKGAKGDKGDTPVKGTDYFDGSKGDQGDIGYYVKATVDRQNFTETNWATYGTVGRSENWSNTSNSGFRVGDLFFVAGTATDSGKGHLAIYRYTATSGSTLYGTCIGHHIIAAKGAKGDNATTTAVATTTTNGLMSAADKVKLNNAVEYVEDGYTIDVGTIISTAGELFICPAGEMLYVNDSDFVPVCMADLIDAVRELGGNI